MEVEPKLSEQVDAVTRALLVIVMDSRSRKWLRFHDPKALEQAIRALVPVLRAIPGREDVVRMLEGWRP